MPPPLQLHDIPPSVVQVHDYKALAQRNLASDIWAYFSGGAADEITRENNQKAWQNLALRPRVLRDLRQGHTRLNLRGALAHIQLSHPIALAPVAYQRLAHPDGEWATAHAASATETPMILSSQSSMHIAEIAPAFQAQPHHLWFQLYWQAKRSDNLRLIEQAHRHQAAVLVLTVDAPVHGVRDRERRHAFRLPSDVSAVMLHGMRTEREPDGLCQGLLAQAPRWEDVQWLIEHAAMPVMLKGISHPEDAGLAQKMGAAGVIVSNHGGRTLDTMPASAHLLADMRSAIAPDFNLWVDGGIRRGSDIFKALALGAQGVLIGRPQVFGLAAAGARGVAHILQLLQDELQACMALCGCRTLEDIQPAHVRTATGAIPLL